MLHVSCLLSLRHLVLCLGIDGCISNVNNLGIIFLEMSYMKKCDYLIQMVCRKEKKKGDSSEDNIKTRVLTLAGISMLKIN